MNFTIPLTFLHRIFQLSMGFKYLRVYNSFGFYSEELQNDIQTAVSEKISQVAGQNPQMIMCVVSNNQGDRYATIKKRCYLDFGVPSQVMVAKTITPKDKTKGIGGLMSVATKVAIQMNAKLGGLPWYELMKKINK